MKSFPFFDTKNEKILGLIRDMGSNNQSVALAAQWEFAKAIEEPLRRGMLVGDIVDGLNIFQVQEFPRGSTIEYELDLLAPGTEGDFVAYTNPGNGRLPSRIVEADYMTIPTYGTANAIQWLLRFAQDARTDVVARALQVFYAGFIKKRNNDCFHTLIAGGLDRNIIVYDADASSGQLTKRFFSVMKVLMQRNAGGNSASLRRGKLTDIITSPEAIEDMRNWNLDQIDEITRREFWVARDGTTPQVFGINIHNIDELGEGQEYQLFYTDTLGGSLASGDQELIIGLDLQSNDSFVLPIKQPLEVFPDPVLHREQKAGYYGWTNYGVGVLDVRRVMLGSI